LNGLARARREEEFRGEIKLYHICTRLLSLLW
jgi:hypothetical protein